ncbi:MAG: DUF4157 domain-containing protein [Nitrospirae bacterium]|nr:MAG: DUF4157 domain-containing protein [Nitrospirota bacterium]
MRIPLHSSRRPASPMHVRPVSTVRRSDATMTATPGLPRFLAPKARADRPTHPLSSPPQHGTPSFASFARPIMPDNARPHPTDAYEEQADRMADFVANTSGSTPKIPASVGKNTPTPQAARTPSLQQPDRGPMIGNLPTPLRQTVCKAVEPVRGMGRQLPSAIQQSMESLFGADFRQVRLHTDARAKRLAQSLGANAFTVGHDIFFNTDRDQLENREGRRLLAHELTHVVQQTGMGTEAVQCDLMQSLPTALGAFDVEMATRGAPRPGMEGHIRFHPDPSGPYSAQIGLIQVVNFTDVAGRTAPAGTPVDWRRVGAAAGPGAEAGRMELMTTGTDGAPRGWQVDANTAAQTPGASVGPNYIEHWISPAPHNQFGWLRSPTDVREASLYDYPWFSFDVDFEFETVAKATDTQVIYGSLEWGFGIRSGVVQNEYAQAFDAESPVFREALERFRGYYSHEPVVFYFDTAQDVPLPGEETKLDEVMDYLNRYPDVMVRIEGYADERGRERDNRDLADRRAQAIQTLALIHGLDASRIDYAVGWGETREFSPSGGRNEGSWRANRRVVMSFVRTASTPIVMP